MYAEETGHSCKQYIAEGFPLQLIKICIGVVAQAYKPPVEDFVLPQPADADPEAVLDDRRPLPVPKI